MAERVLEKTELSNGNWRLLGDLMFVASFFVLGGNFWEKLRSLFIRDIRIAYPTDASAYSA